VKPWAAILYTGWMRPVHRPGHNLRSTALIALGMLMAGCGQTGTLYLVMPPTQLTPVTHRPAPVPAATTVVEARCVIVPTPTSNVAPVAAPFPGTVVEDVPYKSDVPSPLPAPASLTTILPACVIYPSAYRAPMPAIITRAAPAPATHPQPQP
jgi:hypothetical protein